MSMQPEGQVVKTELPQREDSDEDYVSDEAVLLSRCLQVLKEIRVILQRLIDG